MHRVSAKTGLISASLTLMTALAWGSSAIAQQSVELNVQPVGQVCLAGQPCVGTTGRGSQTAAQNASQTTPQPASQPASPSASQSAQARATSAPATAAQAPAPVASAPVAAPEVAAAPAPAAFDPAAAYQMTCFACHGTGAAGAPKLGDKAAWAEKLEKGMDSVMVNVTNGINAMPPKGMCMTCSDEDLRALVEYMVSQSI